MLPEVPDNPWGGWLSASSDTVNRIALSLLPSCSVPPIPRLTAEFPSGSSSFLHFSVLLTPFPSNAQQKKGRNHSQISHIPSPFATLLITLLTGTRLRYQRKTGFPVSSPAAPSENRSVGKRYPVSSRPSSVLPGFYEVLSTQNVCKT